MGEPFRWTTLAFPLDEMVLTKRGRVEMDQHPVERDSVQGWGVLLADGAGGPFKLELQYLRALREWRPEEHAGVAAQLMAESRAEQDALTAQAEDTRRAHAMSREDVRRHYREARERARLK